jgi:hypothetical protein
MSIKRPIKRDLFSDFSGSVRESLSGSLVNLKEDGIVSSSGAVTRWNNSANRNQSCYFNGTNAYVSTPDSGALALTGDVQTWTWYGVAAADFTPLALQTLSAHWNGTTDKSWIVDIDTTPAGYLHMFLSTTGANAFEINSSESPAFTDGLRYDVRITRVSSTGVVTFYTCIAGGTLAQLGDPVTGTAGALFNPTTTLNIGAYLIAGVSAGWFNGTIQRFTLHDDDRLAASWDAREYLDYNATTMVSSGDGATYTLNGGAIIRDPYDLDVVLGTGANLRKQPANSLLLDGSSGSRVEAPNSAAYRPTTSFKVQVYIHPQRYDLVTAGTVDNIFSLWAAGQRAIVLRLSSNTNNRLQALLSDDSTTARAYDSTTAIPFSTDGRGGWVQIEWVPSLITFSYAEGDLTSDPDALTFNSIGSVAAVASIHASTAPLSFGGVVEFPSNVFNGIIGRGFYYVDGDLAVDFNPSLAGRSANGVDGDSFFGAEMLTLADRDINNWLKNGTGSVVDNGDGTTTITDSDSDAFQYKVYKSVTCGTSDSHKFTIQLSAGTAASSSIITVYRTGGTSASATKTINWSDPEASGAVLVGNGVYEIELIRTNNGTGNTLFEVGIYASTHVAATTGSVIVHGDVSLQSEWTMAGGTAIQNSGTAEIKSWGGAGIETTVAPALIPTPMTMFMVGKADVGNTGVNQLFSAARASATDNVAFYITSQGNMTAYAGANLKNSPADNLQSLFTFRHNGDPSSEFGVSGKADVTGYAGAYSLEYGSMFANNDGTSTLSGSISRYILNPDKMNTLQIKQAQQQLRWIHKV